MTMSVENMTPNKKLDILYNLKKVVRDYRLKKHRDIAAIFSAYEEASPIAAEQLHNSEQDIFASLTQSAKDDLYEGLPKDIRDIPTKVPTELLSMFDKSKVETFSKKLKDLQTALRNYSQAPQSDAPKDDNIEKVQEPTLVSELRAEFIEGVKKKSKLSAEEKNKLIELANNTDNIKVLHKNSGFYISVDGVDPKMLRTVLAMDGYPDVKGVSAFGQLSRESAKTIKEIAEGRSKAYKTSKKLQSNKEANDEQKQNNSKKRLAKKVLDKQGEVIDAFAELAESINPKALYQALALDDDLGKKLLAFLHPKNKQNAVMQDDLRAKILDAVIWDNNLWGLYKEQNNDNDSHSNSSYYKKLIAKLTKEEKVGEKVGKFMADKDKRNRDTDKCYNDVIAEIAGVSLPTDLAKDAFLEGVYAYGMGNTGYTDKFTMEKFDQMNEVLDDFGYQIRLEEIAVEKENHKGSMEVSATVLQDMQAIKAMQNKTIALMYRWGELLAENSKLDISSRLSSAQANKLYSDFCNIGYKKEDWKEFASDKVNRDIARDIYNHFHESARSPEMLVEWLDNLAKGKYANDNCSSDHVYERKYAGLFNNSRIFNARDNITVSMCIHPADTDVHKDEKNKFDMREVYLCKRNGKYITVSSVDNIKQGDILCVPVAYKKSKDGKYAKVIAPGTLLVTSQGLTAKDPMVASFNEQRSISQKVIKGETKGGKGSRI